MILGATAVTQGLPLTVTISPNQLTPSIANGTSVSAGTLNAVVAGGFGPFSYSWTDNMANATFQASTSISSEFQSTGTNVEKTGVAVLIVTDARGVAATASAVLDIIHGTP